MQRLTDDICSLVQRHCRAPRQDTAIAGLTLFRADRPSPRGSTLYQPTLCFVVQGRKRVVLGGCIYEYDRSHYLIATVDVPISGCIVTATPEQPYLGLTLTLDPARIASLLLDLPGQAGPQPTAAALATGAMDASLAEPMARLLRLLDTPADAPVLAPLIERELHYRLLQGPQGGLLRQVATANSRLAQVGRAAAWIRSRYAEPLRVGDLARLCGMSATSFHRHFKAVTTLSPLQYRKQVRLQEARRLMLLAGQATGTIGFDVGYDSPSQFSREYHRFFGLTPSADAARLLRTERQ